MTIAAFTALLPTGATFTALLPTGATFTALLPTGGQPPDIPIKDVWRSIARYTQSRASGGQPPHILNQYMPAVDRQTPLAVGNNNLPNRLKLREREGGGLFSSDVATMMAIIHMYNK